MTSQRRGGTGDHNGVIILDRDGTLVVDHPYSSDPADLKFAPNAAQGLAHLASQGHRLVVVTNQSGVGRGLFPLQRVAAMNARLSAMALEVGASLEQIYFCPHAPHEGCDCRKPAQGLMRRAAFELGFEPRESVVIGDKDSDVEFGRRAGAASILIGTPSGRGPGNAAPIRPDYVAEDLMDAALFVDQRFGLVNR